MALSPDGRWLAVGGFMGPGNGIRNDEVPDIRLYDFPTGKLVARLKGHTNAVLSLASVGWVEGRNPPFIKSFKRWVGRPATSSRSTHPTKRGVM